MPENKSTRGVSSIKNTNKSPASWLLFVNQGDNSQFTRSRISQFIFSETTVYSLCFRRLNMHYVACLDCIGGGTKKYVWRRSFFFYSYSHRRLTKSSKGLKRTCFTLFFIKRRMKLMVGPDGKFEFWPLLKDNLEWCISNSLAAQLIEYVKLRYSKARWLSRPVQVFQPDASRQSRCAGVHGSS